jgi:hypothetical protein
MNDEQIVLRRFNLGDAMIAVSALALFCAALARSWLPAIGMALDRLYVPTGKMAVAGTPPPIDPLSFAFVVWSFVPVSLLICFLAFAAFRLRRPRRPLRVVLLQPGMVAFWAVAFHLALEIMFLTASNGYGPTLWPTMVLGCCVLPLAWGAMKLTKRWRPEPSWIDGLGRVLGVCWWSDTDREFRASFDREGGATCLASISTVPSPTNISEAFSNSCILDRQ